DIGKTSGRPVTVPASWAIFRSTLLRGVVEPLFAGRRQGCALGGARLACDERLTGEGGDSPSSDGPSSGPVLPCGNWGEVASNARRDGVRRRARSFLKQRGWPQAQAVQPVLRHDPQRAETIRQAAAEVDAAGLVEVAHRHRDVSQPKAEVHSLGE